MQIKYLVPVMMVAASLAGYTGEAHAKNGKQGAALLGGAAGVAVGAIGATMYHNSQQSQPQARSQEYTGSTYRATNARYSDAEECNVRRVELFDRKGNYVKTERMRVCN